MFFIFLLFIILINFNFFSYNENLLLCIIFIIFFGLSYIIINKKVKELNFLKIFKIYYLILILLRLNNYFYKLLSYFYLVKKNILNKCLIKINWIKNNFRLFLKQFFENHLNVINILFYLNLNKNFKIFIKKLNFKILLYIDKLKAYDSFLFY
jgi:hypothetical protein